MTFEERAKIYKEVKEAIKKGDSQKLLDMGKSEFALSVIISHLLVREDKLQHIKNTLDF